MIFYRDKNYKFYEIFNEKNGMLFRSSVKETELDPTMRSFPELLDVGIMGHCSSGKMGYCGAAGIDCYQKGDASEVPHMDSEDFEKIAKQAAGKTFQIALGGAGDPNKHPELEKILRTSCEYGIVPNMTISGYQLLDSEIQLIKDYCGAVAVSWYSRLQMDKESNIETNPMTKETVKRLLSTGCRTNVHFVVSSDTMEEAIIRLEKELFPKGIDAVIFILYKPIGYGKKNKIPKMDDRMKRFIHLATEVQHPFRVGFDTCFTAGLVTANRKIPEMCIDACEAGCFSMYIDSQLNCYPCSFGQETEYVESMRNKSLREIWNGETFQRFRNRSEMFGKENCRCCNNYTLCQGGCKLGIEIDLCSQLY